MNDEWMSENTTIQQLRHTDLEQDSFWESEDLYIP